MRIDVKKFLFVGLNSQKEEFFKKAQEFGIVHFISPGPTVQKVIPPDVENVSLAIKVLRSLPVTEQEDMDDYSFTDGIVHKILELKHGIEKLTEEERIVRLEIARVTPFGDFSNDELKELEQSAKRYVQFYVAKQGFADGEHVPETAIYLTTENGLDYFVAINAQKMQFDKMVEVHIPEPLGMLRQKHRKIVQELHQNESWLKTYAKYNTFLHHGLVEKLNKYHLHEAKTLSAEEADGSLFVIDGWVPQNKIAALHDLTHHLDVHAEEIAIEKTDVIPTYLENTGFARVGEDLVHIYDTPSRTDKDPSLWVLFFFSLFFAMILGDAGYGLVLLCVALYIRYKMKKIPTVGQRVLNLFTILCFATIGWGFLTTSFFGYPFPMDSPIRKVSVMQWLVEKKAEYHIVRHDEVWREWVQKIPQLKDVTNPHQFIADGVEEKHGHKEYVIYNKFSDNIMMEMAILVGVIHVMLSFIRYLDRNWSGIGWIIFLIGCYLYVPHYLHATSIINFAFGISNETAIVDGLYLIAGGATLAWVLALIQHRLGGLLEGMNVIQIFGDVLSYLRLYALGLSGALVMATINDLASALIAPLAILVLVFGHAVNIILGVMGGIIHGLRLNFLEWYHYSFEGGGKRFIPLEKIEIE